MKLFNNFALTCILSACLQTLCLQASSDSFDATLTHYSAIDEHGNVVAVWTTPMLDENATRVAPRRPLPTPPDRPGKLLLQAPIATDAAGNQMAVWVDDNDAVQASTLVATTTEWQPPVQLSPPAQKSSKPKITMALNGDAIVSWMNESDHTAELVFFDVQARNWTPMVPTIIGANLSDFSDNLGAACAHSVCTTGVALTPSCDDPCVAKVCSFDNLCCTGTWDNVCIGEAVSICMYNCDCTGDPNGTICDTPNCTNTCQGGVCTMTPAANGVMCSTNDCMVNMTCQAGACVGGMNAPNGQSCGTPDCSQSCVAGACTGGGAASGSCFDDLCMINKICQAGSCSGGMNAPDGLVCSFKCTLSCQSGVCSAMGATSGYCDANVSCTIFDMCQSGTCVPGPSAPNGTACDSGIPCTINETCQSGTCVGGMNAPNGTACDDGNTCTTGETCQAGMCTGGVPFRDGQLCGFFDCTESCQSGMCVVAPGTNGVTCNPFDCTTSCQGGVCSDTPANNGEVCVPFDCQESCQAGVCVPVPIVCNATDQCHTAGTCIPNSETEVGGCTNPPVTCMASDQCHTGVCTLPNGCSNIAKPNATPCTLLGCVSVATCQSGMCVCSGNNGPAAPQQLTGVQIENEFLTQIDRINHLTWKASSDPTVVSYRIFRNGTLIATIPASGPLLYNDHNRNKNKVYTYSVVSVNGSGVQSAPVSIVL